jgi:hypothetical protein
MSILTPSVSMKKAALLTPSDSAARGMMFIGDLEPQSSPDR